MTSGSCVTRPKDTVEVGSDALSGSWKAVCYNRGWRKVTRILVSRIRVWGCLQRLSGSGSSPSFIGFRYPKRSCKSCRILNAGILLSLSSMVHAQYSDVFLKDRASSTVRDLFGRTVEADRFKLVRSSEQGDRQFRADGTLITLNSGTGLVMYMLDEEFYDSRTRRDPLQSDQFKGQELWVMYAKQQFAMFGSQVNLELKEFRAHGESRLGDSKWSPKSNTVNMLFHCVKPNKDITVFSIFADRGTGRVIEIQRTPVFTPTMPGGRG